MKTTVLVVVMLVCGLGAAVSLSTSTTGRRHGSRPEENPTAPKPSPDDPQAVIAKADRTFDFGQMRPFSEGEHTFAIRNEGKSDLKLEAGTTTCKCTAFEILDPVVPPGEEGRVRLAWKTAANTENFRHGGELYTNDLLRSSIELNIRGAVRTHLGASPLTISLPGIEPGESRSGSTTIYSQQWEEFGLHNIESDMEGLTWSVERITDEDELAQWKAQGAYRLTVEVAAGLEAGRFDGTVSFDAAPQLDSAESQRYQVAVSGSVAPYLRFMHNDQVWPGPEDSEIDTVLRLGLIRKGEGSQETFLVKLRGTTRELDVQKVETDPEFLQASLEPYRPQGKDVGLFRFRLRVPEDAPEVSRLKDRRGVVTIHTNHPQVPMYQVGVDFAVLGSE